MQKISFCLKLGFLWFISSAVVCAIVFLVQHIAGVVWWPTGISSPNLEWVVGDSWAIANDGDIFHKEQGDWTQLDIETSEPLIFGAGTDGELVIVGKDKIYFGTAELELPKLKGAIVSTGEINICSKNAYTTDIYAYSASEMAIYDWSHKDWIVLPLENHLDTPGMTEYCNLYYVKSNALHLIRFEMPDTYAYNRISLIESQKDMSAYGGIKSMASSQKNVWILTGQLRVYRIEWYDLTSFSLVELPDGPPLRC